MYSFTRYPFGIVLRFPIFSVFYSAPCINEYACATVSQFSYKRMEKRKWMTTRMKVGWQFFKLSQLRDIDFAVKLNEDRGMRPASVEFTQKPSGLQLFDF